MALSRARIVAVGETPYAHEREGIAFAEQALPDTDPYHLWALVDLLDPTTGRLHEIDLVVLGYSCIYLVELKAWPGRIEGDSVDWTWVTPEGRRLWRDNPRSATKRKAQVLRSRLERALPSGIQCPWVEPLVFLSHADVKLGLAPEGLIGVVRRDNFCDAITKHVYPGADPRFHGRTIDRPTMRAVVQALTSIGFRQRKGKLAVGSYELGSLLDETATYQDREATHRQIRAQHRRARTYLVPEQTSVERRQQLLRAAEREAQLLHEVREHPNILRITDYVPDAPLGPTVLLDDFERGVPLDAFLRMEPQLPFADRIAILEQLANALGHCHRRQIVHGGLSPAAVLVRRAEPTGAIEIRLFNFQLGSSQSVEATSHWSQLATDAWAVYQAPELRRDPTQRTIEADMFSLGAIAYLVITGQPPGATIAEVEARMKARRCLDPRDVSNDVPPDVADAIAMATEEVLAARANDVAEWIDLLVEAATGPVAVPEPERSPLDARRDDIVGDYKVLRVLGHGASSRVLEVEDDASHYALKVSLGPEHDDRIRAEGQILAKLRHPRIVRLEKQLVIAGRPCLLMSVAGHSLQRELAEHGMPSLDFASRYGIDLLDALVHLEDEDVLHRDIKPANVGVGSVGKKSKSLTLFDFSLASVPVTEVGIGTAAYRDPQLPQRGRWDAAADRYAAAITLYELVTGQRPTIEADGTVAFAAERFDAAVRTTLTAFFQRAFTVDATARHASAADMRRDWERAFEAQPVQTTEHVTATEGEPDVPAWTDEQVAALVASTPVQALPLTARAKNALDRAGVLTVGELRDLPQNRLSAMRGVGRQVAKDILDFRDRWLQLAGTTMVSTEPAFFPGYRGADGFLQVALAPDAALGPRVAEVLGDAGLRTPSQLAAAPKSQVAALAARHGFDTAALTAFLTRENDAAQARHQPTSIQSWTEALLPANKKQQHARALFGLEPTQYAGVRELAGARKLTQAAIYLALGKSRVEWASHPAIGQLVEEVHDLLDRAGGAVPLEQAGSELLGRIAHAADDPDETRRASALVRVVAEVDKERPDGIRFVRLRHGAPWIVRHETLEAPLEQLGRVADELAARDILVGSSEAHRALAGIVADTPLASLPAERLVRIAAAASTKAAASIRLELYPRGMDARRALDLSAAILPSKLDEAKLRELVSARYPEAAALPPRPALDELVANLGLNHDAASGEYSRPDAQPRSSLQTRLSSYTRVMPLPSLGPELDSRQVAIQEFEDTVRVCLERRALLVLGVTAERSVDAEQALARRFGLAPRSFDALFLAELERQMQAGRVQDSVVYDTDALGMTSDAWPKLVSLARRTSKAISKSLLPPTQPLLLGQLGLVDRYGLVDFLREVVDASKHDASEAILLLVPGHERGVPRIGETIIPDLLPGQSTWIPKSWIGAQLAVS